MNPEFSLHIGIVSARFLETWDFYTTVLDFRTEVENDGYVRLAHPGGPHLSILQHELNGEWPDLVNATEGRGIWFTLEVDDPAGLMTSLNAAGIEMDTRTPGPKWGNTSFVVRDPNGVLIFVADRKTRPISLFHEMAVG